MLSYYKSSDAGCMLLLTQHKNAFGRRCFFCEFVHFFRKDDEQEAATVWEIEKLFYKNTGLWWWRRGWCSEVVFVREDHCIRYTRTVKLT